MTEVICRQDNMLEADSHSISVGCGAKCKGGASLSARPQLDQWLHNMLHTQFFSPCQVHKDHKKNEATYFCADCGLSSTPLCSHCLSQHSGHRVIQIRRYVYCDVVRACDMSPHLDVSGVQTYIINQAKVMFLNQRPQSKMGRPGAPDACHTCARTLRDGCSYCSLACKVESLVANGKLRMPASCGSGCQSDSGSDCWPSMHGAAQLDADAPNSHDGGSGDSSSSHQEFNASSWGVQQQQPQQHQRHAHVGAVAAHVLRRHSDSDSERSSGSYCSRRKQNSPRRSPLL